MRKERSTGKHLNVLSPEGGWNFNLLQPNVDLLGCLKQCFAFTVFAMANAFLVSNSCYCLSPGESSLGAPSLLEADQADSAHWVSAFFFTASGAGYYLQAAR